jgi:hypothetical protein
MERRSFHKTVSVPCAALWFARAYGVNIENRGASRVEIGRWCFSLPSGWKPKPQPNVDIPYFESDDGAKGCYAKSLVFKEPVTRDELATAKYVQGIHRESFLGAIGTKWKQLSELEAKRAGQLFSTLELYDQTAKYRIVSCVLVHAELAIQVTFHDYWCPDLAKSKQYFNALEQSISARSGDA